MSKQENIINTINKIVTGDAKKRRVITPLVGLVFLVVTAGFVVLPLYIENILGIRKFIYPPWNLVISVILIAFGLFLVLWSNANFFKSRGTPVPFNPPPALIENGPFAYSRNPMITGLVITMFGFGVLFGSILCMFVFTPLYFLIHYLQIKNVEELELEKRLGENYKEKKKRVPRFFPKFRRG